MGIAKKTEDGELLVRDSQLAAFFCQRPYRDLAKAFGKVFEDWLARTPDEAKRWALIGPDADEFKPFNPKLLVRARAQFDPIRAKKIDMSALELGGPQETNPDHSFVFVGDNDIEDDETNLLEIRSPNAEVDSAHVERYVESIRHIAEQLPYESGYASPALTHLGDRQKADFAKAARKWAARHPGYDMPDNDATNSGIGRKLRGAYWLTFVGPWALKRLGGKEALQKGLPNGVTVEQAGVGVMIRAGHVPELGDVNRGDKLPELRKIAKVLEPVTLLGDRFLNTIFTDEDERARWGSGATSIEKAQKVISTPYSLPFAFEAPGDNPWNGRRPVQLTVHGAAMLDVEHVARLKALLAAFCSLGEAGGLAGTAVAPWLSACKEPTVVMQQGAAVVGFDPCVLDERATHCLLCILSVLHEEISLTRVAVSVPGSAHTLLPNDPNLEDPYPGLWVHLPFHHEIEESESETRVLRARFAPVLTDAQAVVVHTELMRWGTAAAEGAFGIAPIEPRRCGCLPVNPVENYEGELSWAIEKCRFHYGALRALVAVCATIHHRIAKITELVVE